MPHFCLFRRTSFPEMFKNPFFAVPASIPLPTVPLLHETASASSNSQLGMATIDDLPWPELGNVSRGATRGNQGQKGFLGPPDHDGRCILQLRVQPGVLAVRLNRKASEWYRILDSEVNRALKLTKTYWRKARRRQDYDANADQDHMELHEWLQQLKDKTMSHLELLMQKGDIPGPPYAMPDDLELSFLRKFIERQANGIPHNPRLRNNSPRSVRDPTADISNFDPSNRCFAEPNQPMLYDRPSQTPSPGAATSSRLSHSPSLQSVDSSVNDENSSEQSIQTAKTALVRAKKDTQAAFMKYTTCLEVERQARQAVAVAEKRRNSFLTLPNSENSFDVGSFSFGQDAKYCSLSSDFRARRSSFTTDDRQQSPSRFLMDNPSQDSRSSPSQFDPIPLNSKSMDWNTDIQTGYASDPSQFDSGRSGKRGRSWESLQSSDRSYSCEDMGPLPPRKRLHMEPGFDIMNNATIHTQRINLQT